MFPGQEMKIYEFYQKNPQQLEELRGPILEEKAVDLVISKADVKEKKVSVGELMAPESAESESYSSSTKKKTTRKKAANE